MYSFLYVVGSVGYFPTVIAKYPTLGIWGFIVGRYLLMDGKNLFMDGNSIYYYYYCCCCCCVYSSAFIFGSQVFKVRRILVSPTGYGTEHGTAFHLEFWAGIGGLMFLIGTAIQAKYPAEYLPVTDIWMAGSVFFQISGLVLGWRHLKMGV